MPGRVPVYLFRAGNFARNGDSVVSVAPRDIVISVYGGGGFEGSDGLAAAFDGGCVYRNDDTGASFLGVWGARKASRFRAALRQSGLELDIVRQSPPARLTVWMQIAPRQKGQHRPL
jgi:hypothetical protein